MTTCEVCGVSVEKPLRCEVVKDTGHTFWLRVCGRCAGVLGLRPSN